jgi:hypothetical protein
MFFADTVLHLNRECITLQGQLNEYRSTATTNFNCEEKIEFVKNVSPTIKKARCSISSSIFFPSTLLEVTTSKDRHALLSFGLTEKCSLATLVFESIFKSFQGTASKPVNLVGDNGFSVLNPVVETLHLFDTSEMRELLWFDFGIGPFAVKTLNSSRNTYTNLVCNLVNKYCMLFSLILPYLTMCYLFAFILILRRRSFQEAQPWLPHI